MKALLTIRRIATPLAIVGLSACGPGAGGEMPPAASGETAETTPAGSLQAGFLVVDGVYNTELTAPFDVLEHTLYHAPEGTGIEVFTVSPDGLEITTAEGLRLVPDFGFDDAPPIDILVVPSAEGSRDRDLANPRLVEWVRETGAGARFVISLCWGAFVLAEAGLLDDVSCTTFPGDYDTFAQRFPGHDLRVNVSFVHSGKAITSQGGARSFDAAMYLVDLLYGRSVAQGIGRGLLIPWPQPDLAHVSDREPAPIANRR